MTERQGRPTYRFVQTETQYIIYSVGLCVWLQVLAEFSWEQVQLAIHRTTTKSLMNIIQKIQDFILQQKRRSERTISIMLPADTRASKALAAYREKEKQAEQERDMQNGEPGHTAYMHIQ